MKNWKTTLIGIGEAVCLQVTAEQLFELTNTQRLLVVLMAIARATFAYFAKDRDVTGAS